MKQAQAAALCTKCGGFMQSVVCAPQFVSQLLNLGPRKMSGRADVSADPAAIAERNASA
jgi:hypothetical protein